MGDPKDGRPLRVLIVDDCHDAADSLHILMGLWGHESQVAYGGTTALTLSREFSPDVVLLDLGMPGLSGWQLARLMRQQEETAMSLILAITGYGRGEDYHQSQEAGCDYHLLKPVDPQLLYRLLDGYHNMRDSNTVRNLKSNTPQGDSQASPLHPPLPAPKAPLRASEKENGTLGNSL